jgi:hypothetical protein
MAQDAAERMYGLGVEYNIPIRQLSKLMPMDKWDACIA